MYNIDQFYSIILIYEINLKRDNRRSNIKKT